MAKQYDNSNSGVIFRNAEKTEEKHPDMRGSLNVTEPGEYWVSGWSKVGGPQSKNPGEKFLSLSLTKKDAQGGAKSGGKSKAPAPVEDDLPFAWGAFVPYLAAAMTAAAALIA